MHILVLPSWFENSKNPTLGSFFKDQAIALADLGHQVGIIHPNAVSLKGLQYWRPRQTYNAQKIQIFTKSYLNVPKLRQFNIQRRINSFETLFKEYINIHGMPDVLHAHSCALGPFGSAGIAANHISKKYKLPYVITEHASSFHTQYYQLKEVPLIKNAFANAAKVIAVSQSLMQDLKNFGISRDIKIIGNIVDTKTFTPHPHIKNENYTFVVVAYLRPIKHIDLIIKAFALALQQNPKLYLKVIGDGEQKKALEELTVQLKICQSVKFFGELNRKAVADEVISSDCYLLTSSYETFAVAAHEALAAGKAVISSNCGGPEHTIKHLDEVLLPALNKTTLSQAMLIQSTVLKTPDSMQKKHQYITQHFSSNAIAEKLTVILEQVISNKSSKSSQSAQSKVPAKCKLVKEKPNNV